MCTITHCFEEPVVHHTTHDDGHKTKRPRSLACQIASHILLISPIMHIHIHSMHLIHSLLFSRIFIHFCFPCSLAILLVFVFVFMQRILYSVIYTYLSFTLLSSHIRYSHTTTTAHY
ncbi:hypothetical protein R3P38DRAFT_2979658 [Favolaschia claudopus]|uniref:Uncharacterized protein n=1 Tax=Favolaschia claudopus TaxID=2862362 RepID=A0AAW0B0Y9_9AGAR